MGIFESPDPDIDWGRCITHLLKIYGENGGKTAFEMVRTGVEGGIYAVLKKLVKQMIKEYAHNEIKAYVLKYGHLLPSELTEGNATRIGANFLTVFAEHPKLNKRIRKIGR